MTHSNELLQVKVAAQAEAIQPSLVVTVPEALRLLQISRNSLYRMFASGELKRINIAGRVVVRRVDLEALVNKEPMPPSRPPAPGGKARISGATPRPVNTVQSDGATRRLVAARAAQVHPKVAPTS